MVKTRSRKPAAPAEAATSALAEKARPFVARIENLMADRETERGESMARCRRIADDIKEVFAEAKGSGLNVKALKGHVKKRKLEAKIAAIPAEFDIDEQAQYDELCADAERFKDTPMGDHLREKAEAMRGRGNGEEPREDEEHLARIGRGRNGDAPGELVDGLTH